MRARALDDLERLSVICNTDNCKKVNTTNLSAFDIEIYRDFISGDPEGQNYHDIIFSLDSTHADKDAYLGVEIISKYFISRRWRDKWEKLIYNFEKAEAIDFFMLMSYCYMIAPGEKIYDAIANIAWVLNKYQ